MNSNLPYEDILRTSPWQSQAATADVANVVARRGCNPESQDRVDLTLDVYNTLDLNPSTLACFDQLGKPPPVPNLLSNDFQQQLPVTCLDMLPYMLAGLRFTFDLSMGVATPFPFTQALRDDRSVSSTFYTNTIFFKADGSFVSSNHTTTGTWTWTRNYNFKYGQLQLVFDNGGTVHFNLDAKVQYAGNHTSELGAGSFWFSPAGPSLSQ